MRHGGQILVDQLKIQEVRRVFCVPGESYLAALDGLFESGIDTIVGRNEGGVSMMAEAHAKLTGEVGVAFVTRGPGATNASSGVHVAFQDSTPLILLVGQVASPRNVLRCWPILQKRQVCQLGHPSAVRTISTIAIPIMLAMLGLDQILIWQNALMMQMFCWFLGLGWGK